MPALEAFAELLQPELEGLAPGRVVGGWRLAGRCGAGGMGLVWRAVPADGGETVAIQFLRRGADPAGVMRRFALERRALGQLRHRNIASLLDAGVTEDGRPYLVMEHVDGRPIDAWCDERRLDVAGRLRLFRQVCGPCITPTRTWSCTAT
jgi:serine/threonine-protein kinase